MNNKKAFLILFAIVMLGFCLRAYKLGEPSLVTDEFLDMNATYGYFKTGEWKAWDFNLNRVSDDLYAPRDERSWVYRWQVAQLFRFFPPTEVVARSVSVFWGVVSIIALYFVGTYFAKRKEIGLIAAFLFSVGALGISIDRTFRMYAMFFPIFLLFSWFLFRFLEEKYIGNISLLRKINSKTGLNFLWFFPALVFGIVAFMTQDLAANIGVVIASYAVFKFIESYFFKKIFFSKYTVILFLIILGTAGLFIFMPEKAAWYFSAAVKFFKLETKYLDVAIGDYTNGILAYALLFFGAYSLFKKSDDTRRAVWIIAAFFSLIGAAFLLWNYVFGERLIFFALSFGTILLSAGIYYVAKFLEENSLKFKKGIFIGFIAVAFIALPDYSHILGEDNIYRESREDSGYRKIFGYIKKNGKQGDVLLTRNFRNYYYSGAGFRVINLDGEKKITLNELKKIMDGSTRIWGVFGDGRGSFTKDARDFIKSNFKIVKESDENPIYLWEKQQ